MKKELSQEMLMTYIDAAIDFYGSATGHLPTPKQIQDLLTIVGVEETLERIKANGDIVFELRAKEGDEVQ